VSEVKRGDEREGVFALLLPPTPNRYRYATDSISPFRFKVDRPNTGNRSVLMCTPYTLYVHALTRFMCTPLHTLCARPYTPMLTILLQLTEIELEQSDRNLDLSMDRCIGEKYR